MKNEGKELWAKALATKSGREYWRSLRERLGLEDDPLTAGEFPEGSDLPPQGLSRRGFMKLLGASIALAGLEGCTQPPNEKVLPYVERPPDIKLGLPLYYATSMVVDGYARGLLVQSREGRPIKIEGNPEHPASLGATGVWEQASVLGLYDPHRARALLHKRAPASFRKLVTVLRTLGPRTKLRFLMEPQSSPLLAGLIDAIGQKFPEARFTFYSPVARQNAFSGARMAFGRPLEAQYDFQKANVILSLDADFLSSMPNSLRWARQFADRRRISDPSAEPVRLYVTETTPSPTGTLADHRLRVKSQEVGALAAAFLSSLLQEGGSTINIPEELRGLLSAWQSATPHMAWAQEVARDLREHSGAGIVIVGDRQPPAVHVLAHLINATLGNLELSPAPRGASRPITLTTPALLEGGLEGYPLASLVEDCREKQTDALIILGANPSYTAPADLDFSGAIAGVPLRVYLGLYENETARDCDWFIPEAHYLESWGDARAYDGTLSCIQPLIAPLYEGKTSAEILSLFISEENKTPHQLLQESWAQGPGAKGASWEEFVQRGYLADSAFSPEAVEFDWAAASTALAQAPTLSQGALELSFYPDPKVYDGRFANNGWLQELPSPLSKLTWDNAAILSPATAKKLGVQNESTLSLSLQGREIVAPVLVLPGQADDAISLHLGYGRQGAEAIARGVGVNAYTLRTTKHLSFGEGLTANPTPKRYPLALTQTHWSMLGRPIALMGTLEEYRDEGSHFREELKELKLAAIEQRDLLPTTPSEVPGTVGPPPGALQPDKHNFNEQWAMTVDTSVCTGCSACVVACQAENNIPIVGKKDVRRSREMHWLRIDRYFVSEPGKEDEVAVLNQPMMCQHCEKAPCEYVCPVNATVHSTDGLNEMIYNRCVGTRFCSNNCPYKVRRFNWFDYVDRSSVKLARNPEVTVRERGVMEKCTYCVQRIRAADIRAQLEGRAIEPNEVTTACQQACPTRAIQFGSLRHTQTDVVQWREQTRSYVVLNSLGTRPRTHYLAKITNPNPRLRPAEAPSQGESHE